MLWKSAVILQVKAETLAASSNHVISFYDAFTDKIAVSVMIKNCDYNKRNECNYCKKYK